MRWTKYDTHTPGFGAQRGHHFGSGIRHRVGVDLSAAYRGRRLYGAHAVEGLTVLTPRDATKAIIAECATKHGVTVNELLHDRSRNKRRAMLAAARRECARRLRLERGLSAPQIGAAMHRHHSSVLYLLGRLKAKPTPAGFRRAAFTIGDAAEAIRFALQVPETTLAAADALPPDADKIAWWRNATGDERFAGALIVWRVETSGED